MSIPTRENLEEAVSTIASSGKVNPEEVRKVLSAISGLATSQQLPDLFVEFAAAARGVALAGDNACGGGSNACSGHSLE